MCVQLEAFAPNDPESSGDCSWATIIKSIRCHAAEKPAEVAADLNDWADLLEGLAVLNASGPP
jgi:hypothetical protein